MSATVEAAIADAESALLNARTAVELAEGSAKREAEELDAARARLAALDGDPAEMADAHARLTGEVALRACRVTRADIGLATARQTLADAQKRVAGARGQPVDRGAHRGIPGGARRGGDACLVAAGLRFDVG